MKSITRNILGVCAIVLISAGVAGYTASRFQKESATASYEEVFRTDDSSARSVLASVPVEGQPVDLTYAAELTVHAVVHIRSTEHGKTQTVQSAPDLFDFFFGDGRGQQRQVQTQPRVGFGSGVIISSDGYIVTNNHVVEGADEIAVKLNDEREFQGRIIGTDETTDLALLKIEGEDFPFLTMGDSDALRVGEWVLAVGNPFNLNSTVTAGIISAKARSLSGTTSNGQSANLQSYIQTDAAINSGNSGGALVNVRGELVGINSMLYSRTGEFNGCGFAIPTSMVKKVVTDLKQYGAVQRALLGVMCTDLNTGLVVDEESETIKEIKRKASELGITEGIWVREVVEGGSSDGILKTDDVITAIDGKKIRRFADLQEELAKHRPGEKVKLGILRGGRAQTVEVTLKNEQGNTRVVKNTGLDLLGAAFRPLPDAAKRQLRVNYGLEVTAVEEGKMAEAGVRKGFIILTANGKKIATTADLESALKEAQRTADQALLLRGIYPSGARGVYGVDVSVSE